MHPSYASLLLRNSRSASLSVAVLWQGTRSDLCGSHFSVVYLPSGGRAPHSCHACMASPSTHSCHACMHAWPHVHAMHMHTHAEQSVAAAVVLSRMPNFTWQKSLKHAGAHKRHSMRVLCVACTCSGQSPESASSFTVVLETRPSNGVQHTRTDADCRCGCSLLQSDAACQPCWHLFVFCQGLPAV